MPVLTRPLKDAPADIYNQYVAYCNDINAKIHAIDALDPDKRAQANVVRDRAFLASGIGLITPIYQKDYQTATLDKFKNDCASIETQVLEAYNDAMGGGNPFANQIQKDLAQAQSIVTQLTSDLSNASSVLNSPSTLSAALEALKTQVDLMVSGPQKDKALADYQIGLNALSQLQTLALGANTSYQALNQAASSLTQKSGVMDQLQALASIPDANQGNQDSADSLVQKVVAVQSQDNSFLSTVMAAINAAFNKVKQALSAIQNDINPQPVSGKIENACWYIDWTSWDFPVPEGVNMVNIFVGTLAMLNGKPTLNGFGNMNLDKFTAFVQACKDKGIPCKASIGGGGGSYDKCWDLLTPSNVDDFAQMLVDFSHTNNLSGIDFDYEENGTAAQKTLIGKLIASFKTKDSSLQSSLCTNASFAGWSPGVKLIMDGAIVQGKCLLDRLYIMSYYDPMNSETSWLTQWQQWLKTNYNFDNSQITVGIDDFDAHAYNISDMASWAASQGMSSGYWAFNPATPAQSNASSVKIAQSYQSKFTKQLQEKPLKSATLIQKLWSMVIKSLHAVFVRAPLALASGLKSCFEIAQVDLLDKIEVSKYHDAPQPSAPPMVLDEDPSNS